MRYVIIENGVVVNAVVADESFNGGWVQSDTANIGDLYDGENFTAPPTSQEDIDAAWAAALNHLGNSPMPHLQRPRKCPPRSFILFHQL